jgi:hypothetical protein
MGTRVRRPLTTYAASIGNRFQERTKLRARDRLGRYHGIMSNDLLLSELMPGLAASGPDPELEEAGRLLAPSVGNWCMRTTLMNRRSKWKVSGRFAGASEGARFTTSSAFDRPDHRKTRRQETD